VKNVTRGKEDRNEIVSFVVQSVERNHGRIESKDQNIICNNYNCSGHDFENYFKLVGYLEWWGEQTRETGQGSSRGKVGQQGKSMFSKGHGMLTKANATQAYVPGLEPNTVITYANNSAAGGLNDKQWQTLVNLLNNVKLGTTEKLIGKRNSTQWIIDTSASYHMTEELEYLTGVGNVLECPIGLLDGKQFFVAKEGRWCLVKH